MIQYRTKDGDMLDDICFKTYQRESAIVDVLNANPRLAALGAVYKAGVIINLPLLPTTTKKAQSIALWS